MTTTAKSRKPAVLTIAQINAARQAGFIVNIDNFEIEIYAPDACVGSLFNRNDPAQVVEAIAYIEEHTK